MYPGGSPGIRPLINLSYQISHATDIVIRPWGTLYYARAPKLSI
jgi:hypothetical protein